MLINTATHTVFWVALLVVFAIAWWLIGKRGEV